VQSNRFRHAAAFAIAVGTLAACAAPALAQTLLSGFTFTNLATGLNRPTAMALAPDGSVYICQQGGALRVWQSGTLTTITTFIVDSSGERGLIGVVVDPDFANNRFIYVYYTVPTAPIHNTIRRITLDAAGNALVAGSEVSLLELSNLSGATNHNGGGMHFGLDGKLYVAVGENANTANAQSIANLHGKMLRLNPDPVSPIPTDNPTTFPGIAGSTTGNQRAIWAVGLRNPFTFNIQPGTGRMFINDVGGGSWEEINDGIAGKNYGWSATEGFFTQSSFPNFTLPLVAYAHSGGFNNQPPNIGNFTGSAITGGAFYNPANPNFPISYSGDYFFGDVVASFIRTYDPAASTGAGFATGVSQVVDLAVDSDGTLLSLSGAGGGSGRLIRITYTFNSGVCCAAGGACTLSNGIGCAGTFTWGGTTCTVNPCPQPTGACCVGSGCQVRTAAACTGTNTLFSGVAIACNAAGNNTTPCCRADFNHGGGITVQDIFDFLAGYFDNDPTTDINDTNDLTVQDIFDFLEAYFTGC